VRRRNGEVAALFHPRTAGERREQGEKKKRNKKKERSNFKRCLSLPVSQEGGGGGKKKKRGKNGGEKKKRSVAIPPPNECHSRRRRKGREKGEREEKDFAFHQSCYSWRKKGERLRKGGRPFLEESLEKRGEKGSDRQSSSYRGKPLARTEKKKGKCEKREEVELKHTLPSHHKKKRKGGKKGEHTKRRQEPAVVFAGSTACHTGGDLRGEKEERKKGKGNLGRGSVFIFRG